MTRAIETRKTSKPEDATMATEMTVVDRTVSGGRRAVIVIERGPGITPMVRCSVGDEPAGYAWSDPVAEIPAGHRARSMGYTHSCGQLAITAEEAAAIEAAFAIACDERDRAEGLGEYLSTEARRNLEDGRRYEVERDRAEAHDAAEARAEGVRPRATRMTRDPESYGMGMDHSEG
jgi:hypothetical protein